MSNEQRLELERLTRAQLIALATQKNVILFREAFELDKDALIEKLADVEDILVPVKA